MGTTVTKLHIVGRNSQPRHVNIVSHLPSEVCVDAGCKQEGVPTIGKVVITGPCLMFFIPSILRLFE
jgi:hypothetical protein